MSIDFETTYTVLCDAPGCREDLEITTSGEGFGISFNGAGWDKLQETYGDIWGVSDRDAAARFAVDAGWQVDGRGEGFSAYCPIHKGSTKGQAEMIEEAFADSFDERHIATDPSDYREFYYLGLKLAVDMAHRFGLDTMESIVKYVKEDTNEHSQR